MRRRVRNAIRRWWACHVSHRCSYYEDYLTRGPAELTHIGYHRLEEQAGRHFENCTYEARLVPGEGPFGRVQSCPTCTRYERDLRA